MCECGRETVITPVVLLLAGVFRVFLWVLLFFGGFFVNLVGWLFGSFFSVLFWLFCFFFLGNGSRVFQKSQDFPDHLLSHLLFYFSFPEMIFLSAKLLGCGTQPGLGTSTLRLL